MSGVFIPKEIVKGAAVAASNSTVAVELPGRLKHELSHIIG